MQIKEKLDTNKQKLYIAVDTFHEKTMNVSIIEEKDMNIAGLDKAIKELSKYRNIVRDGVSLKANLVFKSISGVTGVKELDYSESLLGSNAR